MVVICIQAADLPYNEHSDDYIQKVVRSVCEGDSRIAAIFDPVSGKAENKTYAEYKKHLDDIAVDEVPQSEQKSRYNNAYPLMLIKKSGKHILKIDPKNKFLHGADYQQEIQKVIYKSEP